MADIVIFGTGGMAGFLSKYKKPSTNIVAYLDTTNTAPEMVNGVPVIDLDGLADMSYDYIVIGFSRVSTALRQLSEVGVCHSKIVGYSFLDRIPYNENIFQKSVDDLLNHLLRNNKFEELFELPKKRFFLCGMNINENYDIIEVDFVREQTLSLLAKEINRKKLSGVVAEFGVFQGEFSKKINRLFPDKELYLYDTFEGFDKSDLDNDKSIYWEKTSIFADTNIQSVIDKMPFPSRCVVKKGWFPNSFQENDKKFAFVSIDVDLFDPILEGLRVFYPLLEQGGYIMIHDYNSIIYQGAMDAVQEYCDAHGISYVPIPDIAGSIIITK